MADIGLLIMEIKKGMDESITLIDPIEFKNGKVYTNTPTYTLQRIEYAESSVKANLRENGVLK